MSETQYGEPWNLAPNGGIVDVNGDEVWWVDEEPYNERVVAAVNATANISTEALESGAVAELVDSLQRFIDLAHGDYADEMSVDLTRAADALRELEQREED